jgi:hypothetical protein
MVPATRRRSRYDMGMQASPAGSSSFKFSAPGSSVQNLAPTGGSQRFEGIAFSSSGNLLGVATADANTVFLFRRKPDGKFEEAPYGSIRGPGSGLDYPHDLSFSAAGGTELLAVVQRAGAICLYAKNTGNDQFSARPVFEIRGPETRLTYSDGVTFVPPGDDYLAACNGHANSITFYRRNPGPSIGFGLEPAFELKHDAIRHPDGLALSRCGRWLAVANHGNNTVSIFRRRNMLLSGGKLRYGPDPVATIADPGLRYPHSVAFTPGTNHLLVTNAGANYICAYRPRRRAFGMHWPPSHVLREAFGPDDVFNAANAANSMEGGPKGIAIHGNSIAVCSPECGVNIYSFHEAAD